MGRPRKPPIVDTRPARTAAYASPVGADDYEAALKALEEQGLILRMKKIARLEAAGLEPDLIAVELAKGDKTWTLDLVLTLMGREGPSEQKGYLALKYNSVREETKQSELIDPDADILDLRSYALSVVTQYLKNVPNRVCPECKATPKDGFEAAIKVLKAGGVGLGENVSVVEYRMDSETQEILRALTTLKLPESRLGDMIEAEFTKDE